MTNALWRVVTPHRTTDYTNPDDAYQAAEQDDQNGTLTAALRYNQFTDQWNEWEYQ